MLLFPQTFCRVSRPANVYIANALSGLQTSQKSLQTRVSCYFRHKKNQTMRFDFSSSNADRHGIMRIFQLYYYISISGNCKFCQTMLY